MPSSSTQSALSAFLAVSQHHHHVTGNSGDGGFFGSSSGLGTLATVGLIALCVVYILVKKVGRVFFEGAPWYARWALLGTAGYGLYRLFGGSRARRQPWTQGQPPPFQQPWHDGGPWDGRQPPPRDPRYTGDS
jgi:hypothetical protein